jgi:hypothetical protein
MRHAVALGLIGKHLDMFVKRRQQLGEDGPGAQLQGQAGLVSSIELMRSGFCLLAYAARGRSGRPGPTRPGPAVCQEIGIPALPVSRRKRRVITPDIDQRLQIRGPPWCALLLQQPPLAGNYPHVLPCPIDIRSTRERPAQLDHGRQLAALLEAVAIAAALASLRTNISGAWVLSLWS